MTKQEIQAEIRSLQNSINDLIARSQWMSTSQLDRVDDMVETWENRIKELEKKLVQLV
jgi:peptidoglycan hydrolase CwlO-like protein